MDSATPEWACGLDILLWFGGRIAAELRLWTALDQGLLASFTALRRELGWLTNAPHVDEARLSLSRVNQVEGWRQSG